MRNIEDISRGLPHGQYEYVDVTFNSTANADTIVRHHLTPASPEDIDYVVVKKDRACDVYDNRGLDRRPWTDKAIVLRCSVASAVCTVLLTTRR